MGLDVTAYRKLEVIDGAAFDCDGEVVFPGGVDWTKVDYQYLVVYPNDDFPGRELPLKRGDILKAEDSFGFCAGPYSSYSRWRENLARLAGWPPIRVDEQDYWVKHHPCTASALVAKGGPLWELICFSDCEGVIGSIAAEKLLAEIREIKPTAFNFENEIAFQRFMESLENWTRGLELAADGGALDFG